MALSDGRQRFLAALAGSRSHSVPVGAVTQTATLEQMEESSAQWPAAHVDPQLMAALAASAHTLIGFDCVRVPFDQTVEAGLLGADVDLGDPVSNCAVRSHPVSMDDSPPPVPDTSSGRAGVVLEALRLLRARLDGAAAVLGGVTGPFTLLCQLAGVQPVLMDAVRRPERLQPWLDFAVELQASYANRQVDAGADAIVLEDMSASLDLTSPRIYERLILPSQQRLIAAIRAPVILHVCGSNTRILRLLGEAGAEGLSLEDRTDLVEAASLSPTVIVGGVPPVEALLNGTPEDVSRAAAASIEAGVAILAPGCGIPPETRLKNLRELVFAARNNRP